MFNPLDFPLLVLVVSLFILWIATWIGGTCRALRPRMGEQRYNDFAFVLGATLTLLGLIVGFAFSMAVNRYEQRKNFEEEEANAIGTEYLRAELLPADTAIVVRASLQKYLAQRILWYETRSEKQIREINSQTSALQTALWAPVTESAAARPTPVLALVAAGMNDVFNSQGYAQAAAWNRIPPGGWGLLFSISIFCSILVGYIAHGKSMLLYMILPVALSLSLFLISDIDSPRRGLIHVRPQNLISLANSLR
jgi:hypothetical protein